MEQFAYSTDDPEAVAAFRQAVADRVAFGERVRADCAALGGNKGPLVQSGVWGKDRIVGLGPDDSGVIPDGWRIVRGRLEPKRGKPGEAARQWLADHQPPDVRHAMTAHGLPRHSTVPSQPGSFTRRMIQPALFEHEGTLWACYEGKPGDDFDGSDAEGCTWTPRKLSEFYAARESVYGHAIAEAVSETAVAG
jgi:hypothetical protein